MIPPRIREMSRRGEAKVPENKELSEYKQKLFAAAEQLVKVKFPNNVLEFDRLLKSPRLSYDRLNDIIPDKSLNIPEPHVEVCEAHLKEWMLKNCWIGMFNTLKNFSSFRTENRQTDRRRPSVNVSNTTLQLRKAPDSRMEQWSAMRNWPSSWTRSLSEIDFLKLFWFPGPPEAPWRRRRR